MQKNIDNSPSAAVSEVYRILGTLRDFYVINGFGSVSDFEAIFQQLREAFVGVGDLFDLRNHGRPSGSGVSSLRYDGDSDSDWDWDDDGSDGDGQRSLLYACCESCIKAMQPYQYDDARWAHVADAGYYLGGFLGAFSGAEIALSMRGKAGADVTHLENRNMKKEAFAWCAENAANFKSTEGAASALIKIHPIKARTAARWIAEWKKLQRASTL
jgi:hypothetical protein